MIMLALGWVCGISLLLLGQYLNKKYQEEVKKTSPSQVFHYRSGEFIDSTNYETNRIKESIENNK